MPPKAKFTREEMIAAAFEIVRDKGLGAVTARELGKRLGSSSCPVFTIFKNMEEVNQELIKEAKALYKSYIEEGLKQDLAFRGVGEAYIKFAIKEPRLFQILFMCEQEQPTDIAHTLMVIDESFEGILESIMRPYHITREEAMWLYTHLWIYSHGIATLCANSVCVFTGEEIQTMMTEIFSSLMVKLKNSKIKVITQREEIE